MNQIIAKYENNIESEDNFGIGGGLARGKFASRRHEDAKNDEGKLTLGQANKMFAKASGLTIEEAKEVLIYAVPNMEWHHAGRLPKQYGGGMKKTYFLNATEICNCAKNWSSYVEKLNLSKAAAKAAAEDKRSLEDRKFAFLQANAKKVERVSTHPDFFYETMREMNGKYGWFDCSNKSYKMTIYYSGWAFENQEALEAFYKITK